MIELIYHRAPLSCLALWMCFSTVSSSYSSSSLRLRTWMLLPLTVIGIFWYSCSSCSNKGMRLRKELTYSLFMLQEFLHGHLIELLDLRLLGLHVLPGVGRHVGVLSAFDWRTLVSLFHAISGHDWVRSLRLSVFSSEWGARGFLMTTIPRLRFPAFV